MNFGGAIKLNKLGVLIVFALICVFLFYIFSSSDSSAEAINKGKINLKQLLVVAVKAAQNGGDEIINVKDLKVETKGETNEGVIDPVTTADFNSHCAMKKTLAKYYPELLVISEEAKTKCSDSKEINISELKNVFLKDLDSYYVQPDDIVIWIDPLDATKEFTENLYKYVTTMVCVAVKGKPVIGVIYKPFEEVTYWAFVEQKAHNFKKPESLEKHQNKVLISMSHSGEIRKALSDYFKDKIVIEEAAGAGYKVLEVVFGRANAYLHSTAIKKWDICAGNAILNAVNGRMSNKLNEEISYSNTDDPVNRKGLIATLKNHEFYVGAF